MDVGGCHDTTIRSDKTSVTDLTTGGLLGTKRHNYLWQISVHSRETVLNIPASNVFETSATVRFPIPPPVTAATATL